MNVLGKYSIKYSAFFLTAVKKLRMERLTSLDGEVKEKFIATIFTELKVMHQFPCRFILPLMGISYSEDMKTDPSIRTFPQKLSINLMWIKINSFPNY